MRSAAIRQQIEIRTEQAFGRHVWPHLFRDCAVTELVDYAPEESASPPTSSATPTSRRPRSTTSRRLGGRHMPASKT